MKRDYIKEIRNAETIQEITIIVKDATSEHYDGTMNDETIEKILNYAMIKIRVIRTLQKK